MRSIVRTLQLWLMRRRLERVLTDIAVIERGIAAHQRYLVELDKFAAQLRTNLWLEENTLPRDRIVRGLQPARRVS